MREVDRGVWHWEGPHPDWAGPENEAFRQRLAATDETPNEAARGLVSSYAIDDGERLLLFDPLAVPREIEELAAGREPVVVLTSPWHERDTRSLVERLGAAVFTPPPDEGTPDVAWLLGGPRSDAYLYSGGDPLPVGVEAFPGRLPNDVVLWIGNSRAVIAGDYPRRLRPGAGNPGRMATRRRDARAGGEPLSEAARPTGRSRTRNTRRADRQSGPRSGARLTTDLYEGTFAEEDRPEAPSERNGRDRQDGVSLSA